MLPDDRSGVASDEPGRTTVQADSWLTHPEAENYELSVWATALSIMGIACLANAARYSPFFRGMAVVTLPRGLGVLSLGGNGWNLDDSGRCDCSQLPAGDVLCEISKGSSVKPLRWRDTSTNLEQIIEIPNQPGYGEHRRLVRTSRIK